MVLDVDVLCDTCEFLVGEVDKIVVENATAAKINATLFAACTKLPKEVQPLVRISSLFTIEWLSFNVNMCIACLCSEIHFSLRVKVNMCHV